MRVLAYIFEMLVLAFIITAFVFISKQEHIDEAKIEQEADSTSNANLDKLNHILENDTIQIDTNKTL